MAVRAKLEEEEEQEQSFLDERITPELLHHTFL